MVVFVLKMKGFVLIMMGFVLIMMGFVLIMMNAGHSEESKRFRLANPATTREPDRKPYGARV